MCYNTYVCVHFSIAVIYYAGRSSALKEAIKDLRLQLRVVISLFVYIYFSYTVCYSSSVLFHRSKMKLEKK